MLGFIDKSEQNDTGEDRRSQIVETAARLFSEKGYFQTKIDDIAQEAGVSKGLIYIYFKDKHDVLFYSMRFVLEIYNRDMADLMDSDKSPLAILRMALRRYGRLIDAHKQETVLAYRSTKDLALPERLQIKVLESKSSRIFRKSLEACIHQGIMKPVNVDVMIYQYIMFCHTWAVKHWAFRDKYSFEDYLQEGEVILVDNFLTKHGMEVKEKLAIESPL